jgi:hypothetical protein
MPLEYLPETSLVSMPISVIPWHNVDRQRTRRERVSARTTDGVLVRAVYLEQSLGHLGV